MKGPKDKETETKAWAEYNLLSTLGAGTNGTVKSFFNAYWASAEQAQKIVELADSTMDRRPPILVSSGERRGHLKTVNVKPHHVEAWFNEAYPDCGATTKNTRLGWIKRVFSWGVEVGLCDRSPIAGMKRPTPHVRQDFIESAQWAELLATSAAFMRRW